MSLQDTPPLPDDHRNASSRQHHSDEEKCDNLGPVQRKANAIPNGPHSHPQPSYHHSSRASPPKSNDSRPYIEDDDVNNQQQYEQQQQKQQQQQPRPYEQPRAAAMVPDERKREIAAKVAVLLFSHYPHPINYSDLSQQYFTYYNEPVEINHMHEIEAIIKQNPYITLSENTLAARYDHDAYNQAAQTVHNLQLTDMYSFLHDNALKYDKKLALIRDKINKHMNAYHPEGIFTDQLSDLFRHWIGVEFEKLDQKLQGDIRDGVFDTMYDPNDESNPPLFVMKGRTKPQFPLKEPWKAYAFSTKYQIICVLHSKSFDRAEFLQEYQSVFGHEFNLKSFYNQKFLDQLLDPKLFYDQDRFALGTKSQRTNSQWITWWKENGPHSAATYKLSQIHQQAPHEQAQQYNVNGYGDVDEHKQHYNQVAQPHDQYGHQSQSLVVRNNHNNNDENYNAYQNQSSSYGHAGQGRNSHDPDTLVFIGGIPLELENDASKILQAIEKQFHVKFANRRPTRVKTTKSAEWGYIAPIPLETPEMARTLTDLRKLALDDFHQYSFTVRKYDTERPARRDYRGYGNFDDYQQGGYGDGHQRRGKLRVTDNSSRSYGKWNQ